MFEAPLYYFKHSPHFFSKTDLETRVYLFEGVEASSWDCVQKLKKHQNHSY